MNITFLPEFILQRMWQANKLLTLQTITFALNQIMEDMSKLVEITSPTNGNMTG